MTQSYIGSYSSNVDSRAAGNEAGSLWAVGLVRGNNLSDNGGNSAGAGRGKSASGESNDGGSSETHLDYGRRLVC